MIGMNTSGTIEPKVNKPQYVAALEVSYGAPSQNAFGSAVFFELVKQESALEHAALQMYKYFVGELWERYGEKAWMSAWKQVYARPAGLKHDIVTELRGIADPGVSGSVEMVLDVVENAEAAHKALSNAYDDQQVVELRVYNLGDGAAMSGLMIAGRRSSGEALFLVFLYD
jgi:hypothetical protein